MWSSSTSDPRSPSPLQVDCVALLFYMTMVYKEVLAIGPLSKRKPVGHHLDETTHILAF